MACGVWRARGLGSWRLARRAGGAESAQCSADGGARRAWRAASRCVVQAGVALHDARAVEGAAFVLLYYQESVLGIPDLAC